MSIRQRATLLLKMMIYFYEGERDASSVTLPLMLEHCTIELDILLTGVINLAACNASAVR